MSQENNAEAFTVTRTYDVPRETMFQAWTEAKHLKEWWGPKGFTVLSCTIDLRPGRAFHYGLRAPDGMVLWGKWVFREVAAPDRLVFVASFSDEAGGVTRNPWAADWPLETLSTLTFTEKDGKTSLTMTGVPINATQTERALFTSGFDSMKQGWGGTLDQLANYLGRA